MSFTVYYRGALLDEDITVEIFDEYLALLVQREALKAEIKEVTETLAEMREYAMSTGKEERKEVRVSIGAMNDGLRGAKLELEWVKARIDKKKKSGKGGL